MLTRRDTLAMGLGAAALSLLPLRASAAVEDAVTEFTGGAEASQGDSITLDAPEIAENGNTVPISVSAEGAEEIAIFAAGNPSPEVARFQFGPLAGSHTASTRIRLAQSQDVIAVARMPDGSFQRASREVKVTIGGCGG